MGKAFWLPVRGSLTETALWAKVPGAVSGQYVDGEVVLTAPEGLPDCMTEEDLNAAILGRLFENGTANE